MKSPSASTVKRLFALSGNRCAFPKCDAPLVDDASGKVIGEVCHVRARRPRGPRHVPGLGGRELHAFENLILMCPAHHEIIDSDPETYTAESVFAMKAGHEGRHRGGTPPSDRLAEAFLASVSSTVVGDGAALFSHNSNVGQVAQQIINISTAQDVCSEEASGGSRLARALRRLLGVDTPVLYERHGRLIELRRPPEAVLETLRSAGARALSVRARRYAFAAVFYSLWFGFDVWFVSKVGLDYSSVLDMLPPPAFLFMGSGFTYLAWLNRRMAGRMRTRPLTFGGETHLTRELVLEADFERLAVECVSALRATGALIFEVVRTGDDQVTVSAFKEHGGRWSRFTSKGFAFDELVVTVLREGDRCLVRAETSLGRNPDRSVGYVGKFLKRLIGWGRK